MSSQDSYRGAKPPDRHELPQISDRLTYLYLEKCRISRKDSALQAEDKDGIILIPSHMFLTLILGPGVSITHRAAELLGDSGTSIVWAGADGLKFYGYGKSLASSSSLLIKQAKIVSSPRLHIEAVKRMYGLRFPDEDLNGLTLQQLRGKEGSRMRKEYQKCAKRWGVEWNGRNYDPDRFEAGDPINKALSIANTCLYGVCLAVLSGMGLSPGLGLIHTGLQHSLVFDVADLYKAEITIPLCFEIVSQGPVNLDREIRTQLREEIRVRKLVPRMVKDILYVFDEELSEDEEEALMLWDGIREGVEAGVQYLPRNEMQT